MRQKTDPWYQRLAGLISYWENGDEAAGHGIDNESNAIMPAAFAFLFTAIAGDGFNPVHKKSESRAGKA